MKKKLLIIGKVWPEPKSSAAGSRILQLIEVFLLDNYEITFTTPCGKSGNAFDLESIGVLQKLIELNNSSFDDFVKDMNPDVVLFDRFMMEEQFGWRIAAQCPKAIRILDTEDLHFLRKGRHQAFKDGKLFNDSYLYSDLAKREIASIYRCDLSLIISKFEMELLQNQFKIDKSLLLYLPFMLDEVTEDEFSKSPEFEEREHFITIGNFLHEPNYNAILYLKETIWPKIRKELPKAELHVYGAYASEKVYQLHNDKQGFIIKGFAEDVNQVMQNAKICLAPIRFGAGLKGKLVDALKNGTPSITTSVGAEGMLDAIEACGIVTDNVQIFAKESIRLYQNKTLWQKKHKNTRLNYNQYFDKIKFQKEFLQKTRIIAENLIETRHRNFTGQVLMHHTLQSTKYLSKWIEAKHKAK